MNDCFAAPAPAEDRAYHTPAARRAYNRVGLGLLAFLLVPQLISLPVSLLLWLLFPDLVAGGWAVWINQVFSLYMVGTPLALLVIGLPPADLPAREKQRMPFLHLLAVFCAMQLVALVGSLVSQMLTSLFGAITGQMPVSPLDEVLAGSPLWVILLVTVIIGPILEELVCRKAIMDRMLPHGEKSAILLSSIAFGIIHGNFYQLFYTVGVGILLGYVYARTRRLTYVCGLHILFNFFGAFLPLCLMGSLDFSLLETMQLPELLAWIEANLLPFLGYLLYMLAFYGLALAGVILPLLGRHHVRFEPCPRPLPEKERAGVYFGNVGMILFTVFGVLLLLLSLFYN